MSISLVQIPSGSGTVSVPAGFVLTPGSISKAFTSNNTAGNTIIVVAAVSQQNTFTTNTFTCSDTQGNSYTKVFEISSGNNAGPALAFFVAKNVLAGANTVTAGFQTASTSLSTTLTTLIAIAEYSGLGASPTVQADNVQQNWTGAAISVSITDSNGTTVTLGTTVGEADCDYGLIDLVAFGVNYLFACAMDGAASVTPTISPGGYCTFTEQATPTLNSWYLHFWDSSPGGGAGTQQQPQIFVVT